MVSALDFKGKSDDEIINNAVENKGADGIVVIDAKENGEPWLLDNAILLPEHTTVIINNCKIKLSDKCRDNFFRSANCGLGIEDIEKISDIHIKGVGRAVLEGADHPRATGDGSKILSKPCPYEKEDLIKYADWVPKDRKKSGELNFEDTHVHTYGTDAGKEGESQSGGWQGIGILLANVDDFSIDNIKLSDYHCWGISIEAGTNGKITNIHFDACMSKVIDGMRHNIENQDGIDLRNGCNHILISDITGNTGDDVVALTAIADKSIRKSGAVNSTNIMHSDWSKRDRDIHDVTIRNVVATSNLCFLVRLLPAESEIYNIVINDIVDTSEKPTHAGAILLGEADAEYGVNLPDSINNVVISNVISNSSVEAIIVAGYITDSVISNVINKNKNAGTIRIDRKNGIKNTQMNNIIV